MSNRVILNGGLSALRWNRTTISESPTLNLASAGIAGLQSGGKQTNNSRFLKSLPPKVSHFCFAAQWARTCKKSAKYSEFRSPQSQGVTPHWNDDLKKIIEPDELMMNSSKLMSWVCKITIFHTQDINLLELIISSSGSIIFLRSSFQ